MSDPFIKPNPGDRFRPSADAFSAMLEAGQQARANATSSRNAPAEPVAGVPSVVMRATCATLCDVGDVVSLVGTTPEFGESESLDDRAKLQPVLVVQRGAYGSETDASSPWGIVVRPIPAEGIGSVCVAGVAAARVSFGGITYEHDAGTVQDTITAKLCSPMMLGQGDATILQARHDGEARILSEGPRDGGATGIAWCHVLVNQQGNVRHIFATSGDAWVDFIYEPPTAENPGGYWRVAHIGPDLGPDAIAQAIITGINTSSPGEITFAIAVANYDTRGHLTGITPDDPVIIPLDPLADLSGDDQWIEVTGDVVAGYLVSHIGPSVQTSTYTPISGASASGNQITINMDTLGSDARGHATGSGAGTPIVITLDDVLTDLTITGDPPWITVTGDATAGYALTHGGPATVSASADTVSSVSLVGTLLTVTGVDVGWDTNGHVTGDGAGTGQSVDLASLVGALAIGADDVWIEFVDDGFGGKIINHIGPDASVTVVPTIDDVTLTGTMLSITSVDVSYDAKGHVYGIDIGTPLAVDLHDLLGELSIVGDGTWINVAGDYTTGYTVEHIGPAAVASTETTVTDASLTGTLLSITPVDIAYDARGHIASVAPGTPLEVDLQALLGELLIDGDGMWISVTGNYTTGYTVEHIGPSTATSSDNTVTADVTGETLTITPMTIDTDAKGHVVSITTGTPVEFTDHDEQVAVQAGDTPGYLFAKLSESDAWVELTNNTSNVGIGHADPQAEAGSYTTVAASYLAPTLTITPRTLSVDAKGHVRSIIAGDAINLNLTAVLAELSLTGDGVWIGVTGDYDAGFVIGHIGPSTTASTITIDQVDHAQTDDVTFDERGHNNQATATILIYDRLVRATGSDTASGYLIDKLEQSTWIHLSSSGGGTTVFVEHVNAPLAHVVPLGLAVPGSGEVGLGLNYTLQFMGDAWTTFGNLRGAIVFDLRGHYSPEGDGGHNVDDSKRIEINHADPQATVRTLTVGGQSITIDAKGHVNNASDWNVDVPSGLDDLSDVDLGAGPNDGDLLRWNDTAGAWEPVSPVDVTVLADYRVDGANKKLQKKTRTITVIAAGTESGWIDVHTGADCP